MAALRHFVAVVSGNRPLKRLRHLLLFAMRNTFPLNSIQSPAQPTHSFSQAFALIYLFIFLSSTTCARKESSFLDVHSRRKQTFTQSNAKNATNCTKKKVAGENSAVVLHKRNHLAQVYLSPEAPQFLYACSNTTVRSHLPTLKHSHRKLVLSCHTKPHKYLLNTYMHAWIYIYMYIKVVCVSGYCMCCINIGV